MKSLSTHIDIKVIAHYTQAQTSISKCSRTCHMMKRKRKKESERKRRGGEERKRKGEERKRVKTEKRPD